MNILSKLSIRNLKLNKKRTISTIIGIILSVALICAVASMGISFQATLVENAVNETGYWHVRLSNITEDQIKDIKSNRDVKDIVTVKRCGYAKFDGIENKAKPYFKLFSMDENTFQHLSLKLVDGRFPSNCSEVVISKAVIRNAKTKYEIGDTISYDKDLLFKIVGIIEKPCFESYGEDGYAIVSTGIEKGKNDLYVSLQKPQDYQTSLSELLGVSNYKTDDTNAKYEYKINTELLRWEVFAFSDSTVSMLYNVIGIVIIVILVTSVFCIRNSFAIATTEKIKMYSMLASVGTTKKQIRKNVIEEGLLLGLIGIPMGILAGLLAVYVLIRIVNLILGEFLLTHVDGLVFKIAILPILLSIVLGMLTIYLSARSSAKKASKVSPIEGLRNTNEIQIKNKKLKVPRIIEKLFKTGGSLAYKNLKRSKKKYRTTVISIAVSIFIFITMNAFIFNMFQFAGDYYEDYNYNMMVSVFNLEEEKINQIILQENIEQYTILYEIAETKYDIGSIDTISYQFKIRDVTKINQFGNIELSVDGYYDQEQETYIQTGEEYSGLEIVGLDSKAFKRYTQQIGVSYDEVKTKGILCDEIEYYDNATGKTLTNRRYTYAKGDKIEGELKNKKLEMEIGTIARIKPDGIERSFNEGGYLVVDVEQYKDLGMKARTITIQSEDCTQLEKDLENMDTSIYIYNLEEAAKEEKAMILVIKIFLYGFIAVITLIGVTNIFNTITSNMELRQKEFAMLKSIGMTKKEFNRMIHLETIFYGAKSWIYGTIMGLLGTFAMYKAFSIKIGEDMYIPINAILISAVFVFVFVFIIMRYSIKKINKQNTIETIRKENI